MTTAINYALSGLIEWVIALLFIAGGIAGGYLGMRAAMKLAANRRSLTLVFAGDYFCCRDLHAGAHENSSLALNLTSSGPHFLTT